MAIHENRLDYYLSLNYRIEIERDEEGDYVATVPLLPGCIADGATAAEAAAHVQEAKAEWIAARLEANLPVPEPQVQYSGRWLIRTTPALHRKITECAQREEVSINHFVCNVLSEAVGWRQTLASQSCRVFFAPQAQGQVRLYVAFGNMMSGGLLWQHGLAPSSEPTIKPIDLVAEPAELRA